jgi:HEAT repeat protein
VSEPSEGGGVSAAVRILAVVRLTEDGAPELEDLEPYLRDDDPAVRTAAVTALTETTPDGYEAALVAALHDPAREVSRAAAAGLRELTDVIDLAGAEVHALRRPAPDPLAREVALATLRTVRRGAVADYTTGLADQVADVRIEAVRGLVSLNAVAELATAAADPVREVRVTVAHGLGTVGSTAGTAALVALAGDPEPLVRAAALAATAGLGTVPPLDAVAASAIADPSWEVRKGAATGLGAAEPAIAVPALLTASADPHLDVRKAAVRALARWAGAPPVASALTSALDDSDADVRAYARKALTDPSSQPSR